jgi:ATP-dependent helicase YprA (DUF1998 family)
MKPEFFSSLLPELRTRASRATVGILGFSNEPLRRHLLSLFSRGFGEAGCFLADPVFEATFGWKTADEKMSQLSGKLLHPDVVRGMDKPWGESAKDYRFPADAKPYFHQLTAWKALLGPGCQSVVVTSGTGSGKTECFMVPVLSSIAQSKMGCDKGSGVQAIFLYPLNALIQSQRERLRAWTGPFGGDIRFCLYNGMTPEEAKADRYRDAPNEVHDRTVLRTSPPEILVTNPTMLEYMLVRAQDAPILEKSKCKLRWIVLDEAHNYIGSQAAELALLLRRVLHAFGTSADQVHFVATSATIGAGDEAARRQLQEFLSSLAGVSADRVTVVYGERAIPELESMGEVSTSVPTVTDLQQQNEDSAGLYKRLTAHPIARRLRALFVPAQSGQSFQPLYAVRQALELAKVEASESHALQWLDILTQAVSGDDRSAQAFLPLRMHAFHNTLNGMWACAHADCTAKRQTELDDPEWAFGAVYTDERRHCVCGAPVYPLVSCNDCNQTFLSADLVSSGASQRLVAPIEDEPDEFLLDRDPEENNEETEPDADAVLGLSARIRVLIVNSHSSRAPLYLKQDTLELAHESIEGSIPIWVQDVSIDEDGGLALKCPECEGRAAPSHQFRKPRVGAPFYLGNVIPTLLEYCPDGATPLDMPRRGRRMITFTDSRQGTARIAAKLQQDAERNALRAAVYRKLVSDTAASAGERGKLRTEIDQFRAHLPEEGSPLHQILSTQIQEKESRLAELSAGKAVNHEDMVSWLSSQSADISRWMHATYADSDEVFKGNKGPELLARILLCREFGRRPKRQNSLETLGLVSVQYPKLNLITTRRVAVEQAGFTLEEWRSFLKTALDFFVRQHWAIQLPSNWQRWGAERVYPKQILPPSSIEKQTPKLVKWPKVSSKNRNSRLVRILAYVLKADPMSAMGRDRIDALLLAAWEDLTLTSGLLQIGAEQGRYLDLTDIAYQNITKAWVCPVTRRVLDVTLRGVTPYLPESAPHDGVTQCRPITVPVCDVVARDFSNDDERVEAARAWVRDHPALDSARVEGVWSNLNERIVEGSGFFRAVEHSAQQSGSRLEQYESMFKKGLINLMSCSTTMEMGVDIGGINMVAMNNVPPHPANYLQRAGRAGRRAETRSVAMTVCKNNPHDQHVFQNTTWPFTTRLRTPGISLSSPLIVQRHINSMLLANFLRIQSKEGKLNKLTLEWWMLPRGESRQERFVAWCECFDETKHVDLRTGVRSLTARTVFEGRGVAALVAEAGRTVQRHARDWLEELNAINAQVTELSARDADDKIPMRALEIQLKRLKGEYLLRELATSGVLPGYGFPTDITTFETLNKDSREIQRQRDKSDGEREDNRFQRRELPSRDTVTALREYAPGASVVIDGLVYQSAGITLNWHAPATLDQVHELQNIRQAWRCGHCGASGTFVMAQRLELCPDCGHELESGVQHNLQYLEPAGFSVDVFAETHNDITLQEYVPVEQPWITASGSWVPLPNPELGRFRATPEGSVFHHSSGASRSGYALCLECGRAAPMGNEEDPAHGMPKVFQRPHSRLRGGKIDGNWMCGGSDNPFKIKTGIRFGREYTTDVLEMVLHDNDGQPLIDSTVAFTLAVALRRAIAESLGVEETELGCDTKMLRDDLNRKARVIQVFDVRSAGYSSLVAPELPTLLRMAKTKLQCEAGCDCACQMCLLTFDTRYRSDDLNRQAALEFLSDDWLDSLALDDRYQLLGAASKPEFQSVDEAISRELNRGDAKRLFVYLNGDLAEWDLSASPLRRLMHRLSVRDDIGLALVTSTADLKSLSLENVAVLRSLEALGSVTLLVGSAPKLLQDGACIATVERQDGTYSTWAIANSHGANCDPHWCQLTEDIVVSAPTNGPSLKSDVVLLSFSDKPGVQVFAIGAELDGKGSGFGERFLKHISGGDLSMIFPKGAIPTRVEYEDRYLSTPIACALLLDVISAVKSHFQAAGDWGDVRVQVTTMIIDEGKPSRSRGAWWSDWEKTDQRDEALQAAFDYCGMPASVISKEKRHLNHGRRFTLHFANGKQLVVWLDQGWSYWAMAKQHRQTALATFNAHLPASNLGEALAEFRVDVQGHDLSTQVFVDRGAVF